MKPDRERFMPNGRVLYLTEDGFIRWQSWTVEWRVFITPSLQPRLAWWRFRSLQEATTWFETFDTPQEPRIEWASTDRWYRPGWHRLTRDAGGKL
jgi:hypothetical protein